MFFFWQIGLVDTYSLIQFCVNSCSQYGAIVVGAAAGNFSDIGPKVFIEPLLGLGTSYQFIKAATTAIERRKRIATLASFLATSTSALTTDPATNAAVGGAISAKIAYMRTILDTRGGDTFITYKLLPGLKKYLDLKLSLVKPLFRVTE